MNFFAILQAKEEEISMQLPSIGFEAIHQLRTYEVDNHSRMTVPALVRALQEAAMQNAIELRFSIWDFEGMDINWVLLKKRMTINRFPKLGEQVRVMTYPSGFQRFFAYRDYWMTDMDGNVLASASTTWLLMDLKERVATPIRDFILVIEKDCPPLSECLPRIKGKLAPFKEAQSIKEFSVGWHDLDFNQHLNNVHYISWMLEPLPRTLLENGKLCQLDIHYKAECYWQDQLSSQVAKVEDGKYQHQLVNMKNGEMVARADTVWE